MKKNYVFPVLSLLITTVLITLLAGCKSGENENEEHDEYDGPGMAAEFEYQRTHNPYTGKIPVEKKWEAIMTAEKSKAQQRLAFQTGSNNLAPLTWTERGPYTDAVGGSNGNTRPGNGTTSGRIRAIWPDLADATGKTVWIGGVDGGLWKTTDVTAATPTWSLINDFLSNLAVTSICQDPTNTNTMYFCTGEAFFNADAVNGVGVFKSTDHGVTWNLLPATSTFRSCSKILCDAAGNVYLSTIGISAAAGLQRSTDGGNNWVTISPFATSRIVDFEISSTGRMHVMSGLFTASPNVAYRYNNNPATATTANWITPTTEFTYPNGGNERVELACLGNTVIASIGNTAGVVEAIAKSTDGGATWTTTNLTNTNKTDLNGSTTAGQGWYCQGLAIDPSNASNMMVGSLNILKSTNGGTTFSKITEWVGTTGQYVHADQQNITWYDNGNKLLVGCDGGLFYSDDKGTTFKDKNPGLRIKQFYSVAMHPSSTDYFLAGAQDNGVHQLNGAGLTSSVEVTGGDGAYVAIDQDEPQYQVGSYIYSNFRRSANGGNTWSGGATNNNGQFINPFDYDNTANIVYAGYTANNYLRWSNPQTGFTYTPVALTLGGSFVTAVTVSPYTANRVYFGSDATGGTKIIRADNANATPTQTAITPSGIAGYVSSVIVGSSDNNLIATVSSYGVSNVWLSTNGGTSWTACDGNLPDMPVYWALFHPDNNNKAYIATETGIWSTDALNGASTVWVAETGFPTVKTMMLKYRSSDRTIAAATHGRGLWTTILPVIVTPITLLNFNGVLNADKQVQLSWTTATEQNNKEFQVEMSRDGVNFIQIGKVPGKGNSSNNQSYGYLYTTPQPGISYYRLRQVDLDGKSTYTKIITVNAGKGVSVAPSLYPVPANSKITVNFGQVLDKGSIEILSANGQLIRRETISGTAVRKDVDITALPKGNYFIRLIAGDGSAPATLKFSKQ